MASTSGDEPAALGNWGRRVPNRFGDFSDILLEILL
jgi:hypothetical protein